MTSHSSAVSRTFMAKRIIRWVQVYETEVDLPARANNIMEFSDKLDFATHIEGAEPQGDTFEILDVRKPE